jgi:hypothetical protein
MSLSKRELDAQNEAQSPATCPNCKWNMDDKFIEYPCQRHANEMMESGAEAEYWHSIDAHYAQTMN